MGIRILSAIGTATIVAAMAIALAIYFRVIPVPMALLGVFARTRQPEFSARYYPPDTLAYTWVTLAPRDRQMRYMREIWQGFNEYPGFVSTVDDWKSGFTEETGISFDQDVASWIGPEVSAGILDIDAETRRPSAAVLIGVRDQDAAAEFLDQWIDYVEAKGNVEFDTRTYQENPTWTSDADDQTYSLTDDWLIYATDEDTLHAIVDRIEGIGQGSLARATKFEAARDALAERRFASAYLDYERGEELLAGWGDTFGSLGPRLLGPAGGPGQTTAWLGVAATWVDRGLVTEWVSPSAPADGLEVAGLDDPAGLLPDDTLGFLATSFDPDVDHWRAAWRGRQLADVLPDAGLIDQINDAASGIATGDAPELDEESSLAEALDLVLWLMEDVSGVDPEEEFIDHLVGTAILGVRDFDFEAVRDNPLDNPVDAVAMLSYREGNRYELVQTMNRLTGLAQTHAGMSANAVDVGGEGPATVFDLGPLAMLVGGPIGYQPGYVLHDQYLTVGTTEQALRAVVNVQNGQGKSLSSDAEYRRAMEYLPVARQFLGYVDAHGIVGNLDADDLGLETDQYEALHGGLGVLVIGSNGGEGYSRSVAVITLLPE